MSSEPRQHTVSDWLALHELDPSICRRILGAAKRELDAPHAENDEPGAAVRLPDADIAWRRAVDALRRLFPAQENFIEDTFEKVTRVLVGQRKGHQRALTLDNGQSAYPTIMFQWLGRLSDLMVIAHEFGHAVQIVASKGRFVPPIMREVCAFIGETALLAHALDTDPAQYGRLVHIWRRDSRKYLEVDGGALDTALRHPDAVYEYRWNYPIARYISIRIAESIPREHLWVAFEGDLSVGQALRGVGGILN